MTAEQHNRLKDEILVYLLPRLQQMGPKIEDRLVLIETIMTSMVLFTTKRKELALKVFDILAEGVKERIEEKAE